jgi:hypothetical protein
MVTGIPATEMFLHNSYPQVSEKGIDLDSDSSIVEIELEWCYTLLISEATASPISLVKEHKI